MKAIIVDCNTSAISDAWRQELISWAQALGVDTDRSTGTFVLIEAGHGWRAIFSMHRQRDGRDYVDPNTGRLAVDYGSVRFDVPTGSWPHWFGDPIELPEMRAGHLLDVLAAAHDAATGMKGAAWLAANRDEVTE